MTFYLKYRPKTIEELDLTSVRERLTEVVKHQKFSHAYLFSGPRGTGKTSAARILARDMGAVGIDVIEMDAASNRGIDDIRELRERIGLSPAQGEKKAYIIDEVHMLTQEAFNALLKTLEEPPSHVIFFLCTTEGEKVPGTIVSRCVSIPFQKAAPEEIIRSLTRAARGEKLSIEKGAIELIASSADGSFREAQTMLEEAGVNGTVSIARVEKAMGGPLAALTEQYVDAVEIGETQTALRAVSAAVGRGGDIGLFSRHILRTIRIRLLGDISNGRMLAVAKVLDDRVRTIQYAPLPELSLEIAAIELGLETPFGSRSSVVSSPSNVGQLSVHLSETDKQKTDEHKTENRKQKPDNREKIAQTLSFNGLLEKWPEILIEIKKKNHGIVTLLSHCKPAGIDGQTVRIEASYQFHKDQLVQDRFRQLVEGAMESVCGVPVHVSYALAPRTAHMLKEFPTDDTIRGVDESELVSAVEEIFS